MPTHDDVFETGTALGSGASANHTVKQPGAASLSGVVNRSTTNYSLDVHWLDESEGVVETESVADNTTADTQTTFDLAARSPYAKLEVSDANSGTGAYNLVAHYR